MHHETANESEEMEIEEVKEEEEDELSNRPAMADTDGRDYESDDHDWMDRNYFNRDLLQPF